MSAAFRCRCGHVHAWQLDASAARELYVHEWWRCPHCARLWFLGVAAGELVAAVDATRRPVNEVMREFVHAGLATIHEKLFPGDPARQHAYRSLWIEFSDWEETRPWLRLLPQRGRHVLFNLFGRSAAMRSGGLAIEKIRKLQPLVIQGDAPHGS